MSYLVDLASVPNNISREQIKEMIEAGEHTRLIALGIRVQAMPNDKFMCIKCSCHGVDNVEDCKC